MEEAEISYLPIIEEMTWSYSRIKSFHDCPYSWFLRYIDNYEESDQFYSSYGTYVHKLLERFYKNELSQYDLVSEFLSGFSENVKGYRPKASTVEKYIDAGTEYFRNFEPFDCNTLEVEKKLDFDIEGLKFTGILDYLGEKDGELYIIDNKSRELKQRSKRRAPTKKDNELDDMLKQLYLYAVAVKQQYGKYPTWLCFNCFRNHTFIKEPFNERTCIKTIRWAESEILSIENTESWNPNVEYFHCHWICGVHDRCDYYNMEWGGGR